MNYLENIEELLKHYTTKGAFLTTKHNDVINTMTVSWGFVGLFWGKPCFIVGVRPQRYTKEIIDNANYFTISLPINKLKEELITCGTKSGRDINKKEIVNFIPAKSVDSFIVEGCDAYFECKIISTTDLQKEKTIEEISKTIYPTDDFHTLYFGEIVERY